LDLKVRFKVVLLPRGKVQEDYYRDKKLQGSPSRKIDQSV